MLCQSVRRVPPPKASSSHRISAFLECGIPAYGFLRLTCDSCGRDKLVPFAYVFKRPWRDGTSRVILTPLELIEKLVPLVPRTRAHLTRYHGVLAPAARWRPAVIPLPEREAEPHTDAERHPRN